MKFLVFFSIFTLVLSQKPCIPKTYRGSDPRINCVCNSTYCDEFPPIGILNPEQVAVYSTTQSGKRFEKVVQTFSTSSVQNAIKISLNESQKFQQIFGFGGAFTDAAGINMARLSYPAQKNLIGIGYTVGRIPMASCDFSTHVYSYDDIDGDFNLTHFRLTMEDYNYKIPFIKMAQSLIGDKLRLFASPWSPPGWMKVTGQMKGGGPLKGDVNGPYYQTWANYFVRFFEEYAKNGITYWGVTMENEPENGKNIDWYWQALMMNATMERDFAKGAWGQTLKSNPLTRNLKLMCLDQSRGYVWDYAHEIYPDKEAYEYVDGLAIHWYADYMNSSIVAPHHLTESSHTGGVKWGEWGQADTYAHDIIQVLNNWVIGWVDWNLVLSPQGGPNWVNNWCDSSIIVSATADEFEKQPMYYAMGHFAKFIVPDSYIIEITMDGFTNTTTLEGVAALTPAGQKVVVLNNRNVVDSYQVSIENGQGSWLNLNLEPRSFTTIVWV